MVDTLRMGRADLRGHDAGVDDDLVGPGSLQHAGLHLASRGRDDLQAGLFRYRKRRKADRRRAAANQERLAPRDAQARAQRSVTGLQHLGQCAERVPGKFRVEREDTRPRDARVLGIRPVELPSHAAHHRGHALAGRHLAARIVDDGAHAFDAEHSRKLHGRRCTDASEPLGTIQPEGANLDEHLPWRRRGPRDVLEDERVGATGLMKSPGFLGQLPTGRLSGTGRVPFSMGCRRRCRRARTDPGEPPRRWRAWPAWSWSLRCGFQHRLRVGRHDEGPRPTATQPVAKGASTPRLGKSRFRSGSANPAFASSTLETLETSPRRGLAKENEPDQRDHGAV